MKGGGAIKRHAAGTKLVVDWSVGRILHNGANEEKGQLGERTRELRIPLELRTICDRKRERIAKGKIAKGNIEKPIRYCVSSMLRLRGHMIMVWFRKKFKYVDRVTSGQNKR
jgi:hypothetical protein